MKIETRRELSEVARKALQKCELFQWLDLRQLLRIAALAHEIVVRPDELFLQEGEPASHLFVIVEGSGVAQLETRRGWLSLGLAGPADSAGWLSLVGGHVYPASVRALSPMRVARIDAGSLTLLMNVEPAIGYAVNRSLSELFCRQYLAALETLKTGG